MMGMGGWGMGTALPPSQTQGDGNAGQGGKCGGDGVV